MKNFLTEIGNLLDLTPGEMMKLRTWSKEHVLQVGQMRMITNQELMMRQGSFSEESFDGETRHMLTHSLANFIEQNKLFTITKDHGPHGREYRLEMTILHD